MLSARTRDSLTPLAVMFAVAFGILLLYSGLVHADPVAIAQVATDSGWSLVTAYGPIWGGGLLLFSLGGSLLRANESRHWIAQGRTLALLTGLVSVLGAVALWHFNGASSAGIIATLVAAVSLVLHPVPGSAMPRGSQAGNATLLVMIAMGIFAVVGACALLEAGCSKTQLKADVTAAENDLVNCTATAIGTTPALDLATLVAVANLVAAERAKCTPAGGALNWTCVEGDLEAEGKTLGGCALIKLVAGDADPAATAARVASSAIPEPGRAALSTFRTRVAPGTTYHTPQGDI